MTFESVRSLYEDNKMFLLEVHRKEDILMNNKSDLYKTRIRHVSIQIIAVKTYMANTSDRSVQE